MFEFLLSVLCLGEDMRLPQEQRSLRIVKGGVRLGEGVCLGKGVFTYVNSRTGIVKFLVLLGEGVAPLGKPLHLGEPMTAGGLYLWPVWGWSRGPVCDCLWLPSGPLYDLFKGVIA